MVPLRDFDNVFVSLHSAALLEGIANTGMVELGDIQLATYLAERKPLGQFFFRHGKCYLLSFASLLLKQERKISKVAVQKTMID